MKRWKRGLVVGLAVSTLIGGAAFAALQSQQNKLTGNVIQTANANLQISEDGINYANQQPGFVFNNLIPGGPAVPGSGYSFYLKNSGSTPMTLKLAISNTLSNPDGLDLSKVNVLLIYGSNGSAQTFPLDQLVASSATGGIPVTAPSALNPGSTAQYYIKVTMATDALTGSSATLGNVDFAFSGMAVAQ